MSLSSSSSVPARLTLIALLSASSLYFIYKARQLRRLKLYQHENLKSSDTTTSKSKIFFISQTGTSKALAQRLYNLLESNGFPFELIDPNDYEPEDLPKETLVLIVASTWEDGKPPSNCTFFANWLADSAEDFRVGSLLLSRCKFAVFGVGSSAYGPTFNKVAKSFSQKMRALGAMEILPLGEGDVDMGDIDRVFEIWSKKLVGVLKVGVLENGDVLENSGANGECNNFESEDELGEDDEDNQNGELEIVDLEDIAGKVPSRKSVSGLETNGKLNRKREMVTPVLRANLEKQVFIYSLASF